jgi:hypothetical protein
MVPTRVGKVFAEGKVSSRMRIYWREGPVVVVCSWHLLFSVVERVA